MARIRGVFLREPPKGPGTSKKAALAANPTKLVADAAFPKDREESVKNAAFRVNSGARGEWPPGQYFAIWEFASDVVLKVGEKNGDGSVRVVGFIQGGKVVGEDGKVVGIPDDILQEEGVERGGWVLLIGKRPHIPEGWEGVVNAPGSRKRKKLPSPDEHSTGHDGT